LRNAWTSFKDEGTAEGGAMFLDSPDNAGVSRDNLDENGASI
jgi:hypothetical protein